MAVLAQCFVHQRVGTKPCSPDAQSRHVNLSCCCETKLHSSLSLGRGWVGARPLQESTRTKNLLPDRWKLWESGHGV